MRHVIIGTAGHIDHGKSAIILALTGTDPDRWEEEKRRGITLDLGFAHLDIGTDLRIGFIDVPGHERFVKNMLAGVGGIDLVMLIIAADESVKPQTREHFDICKLLGIRRGLVVLTKSDLVDQDTLDLARLEIQEFVAGSFLAGAPIVAVSAHTGVGLDELKSQLHQLSLQVPTRRTDLPFRLPIDRSFAIKGFGTVVTGTLVAGTMKKEAEVEIFPLKKRVRVRGIEVYNSPAEKAVAGQRTALNLSGIEARQISRGMVLAPPGCFEPTSSIDCTLNLLPSARPLKNHAPVHFHCGTAEMLARVVLLEGKEMLPGSTGYTQLRLSEPGLFVPGDRFIIRQFSPVTTIGGGAVLDSLPPKHRAGDASAVEALQLLETGSPEARLELLVQRAGEATPAALAGMMGLPPVEILQLAGSLAGQKRLVVLGQPPSLLIHAEHFEQRAQNLLKELHSLHGANPLVAGFSKEELRAKLAARRGRNVPSPALFAGLLQHLTRLAKVDIQGEIVLLHGRGVQLSPEEMAARVQIEAAFEKAGLAVPSASEVVSSLRIDRARAEKLLKLLVKDNALLKISDDLIFHPSALRKLRELLTQRKAQSSRLSVPEFKQLTGVSRKYAIPLLEFLDRERVTRRGGNERVIL
jgi:selenocysteine-specific elongation factor